MMLIIAVSLQNIFLQVEAAHAQLVARPLNESSGTVESAALLAGGGSSSNSGQLLRSLARQRFGPPPTAPQQQGRRQLHDTSNMTVSKGGTFNGRKSAGLFYTALMKNGVKEKTFTGT